MYKVSVQEHKTAALVLRPLGLVYSSACFCARTCVCTHPSGRMPVPMCLRCFFVITVFGIPVGSVMIVCRARNFGLGPPPTRLVMSERLAMLTRAVLSGETLSRRRHVPSYRRSLKVGKIVQGHVCGHLS